MLECCWIQCCKGNVESMLQKTMVQKQCWSNVTKDIAKVVLQKMLLQKITNAFVASKCTSTFFFCFFFTFVPLQRSWLQVLRSFSSSIVFTRLWQKMMTNAMLIIILCNPRKNPWCWFFLGCRRWRWTSRPILVSQTNYVHTKWVVEKCRERTSLLVFSSSAKDDNEPLSSLSFFFLKCRRWQWAKRLIFICSFFSSNVANDGNPPGSSSFHFFSPLRVWKMMTSQEVHRHFFFLSNVANDNEPPCLIIIFIFFSLGVANDGEPPWFVIIFILF